MSLSKKFSPNSKNRQRSLYAITVPKTFKKQSKNVGFSLIINLLVFISLSVHANTASNLNSEFLRAQQLLNKSEDKVIQSRRIMLDANKARKNIKKTRAQSRKSKDKNQKKRLQEQANKMAKELAKFQESGARMRAESIQLIAKAKSQFKLGFINRWSEWVNNAEPLTMDDTVIQFIAHNTQIRSVHPTMLNKMGTPIDKLAQATTPTNMTLLVPALASQKAPPDLDIGAFQISREKRYVAHIEVNDSSSGQDSSNVSAVPLNKIHQWYLMVSDLNGNPATKMSIEIEGHMPGHVHGLPTQPQVTEEISPGIYRVEGLKFQMKGWWVMKFIFDTKDNSNVPDEITFNLVF